MIPIELLLAILCGILVGIFSGLTPGIHINMISLLILGLSTTIVNKLGISIIAMCTFIIATGITHTFLDALPSIFLGAPDENTVLGVLPGHRYLLRGEGLMAVKLFTIGSFFGLIFGIVMFPLLYIVTKVSYNFFEQFFAVILIGVSVFMIWRDDKKIWSICIYLIAGIFGMIVFNLNMNDPLFPMLSGLFGIATLVISLKDKNNIPSQRYETYTKIEKKQTFLAILFGNISAFIVSTFPGLSSSIAAVISMQFVKDLGDKGFMILMGCIGTSSFLLSLVALYTIDKARNGAVIVISQLMTIDFQTVLIFLATALIAGCVSVYLSLYTGKIISKIITKINYKLTVIIVIAFVVVMVFIMTSWIGLLILFTSTAIGILPGIVKTQRTHSMACLILPVIFYLI